MSGARKDNTRYFVVIVDVPLDKVGVVAAGVSYVPVAHRQTQVYQPHPGTGLGGVVFSCATVDIHKQARKVCDELSLKMYSLPYHFARPGLEMPDNRDPVMIHNVVSHLLEWRGGAQGSDLIPVTIDESDDEDEAAISAVEGSASNSRRARDPPTPEHPAPKRRAAGGTGPKDASEPKYHVGILMHGDRTPLTRKDVNRDPTAGDRAKHLQLVPTKEHNANTRSIVNMILAKAQTFVTGTHPYYAASRWSRDATAVANDKLDADDKIWAEANKQRFYQRKPSKFEEYQEFAQAFSQHKGITEMHGANFFMRTQHVPGSRADEYGGSLQDFQQRHLAIAVLEVVSMIRDPSPQGLQSVEPVLRYTVKMMSWQNLIYLAAEVALEHFHANVSTARFASICQSLAASWHEPKTGDSKTVLQSKQEHVAVLTTFSSKSELTSDLRIMAAAGLRPQGRLLSCDADTLACLGYPLPPTSAVVASSLTGWGWEQIDFVWSAITQDRHLVRIKGEPGVSDDRYVREGGSPAASYIEALQPASLVRGNLTIVIEGKLDNPNDAALPAFEPDVEGIHNVWALKVDFKYRYFRGVIVTSAAYRRERDDHVTVRLTFAHASHLFVAWATMPLWLDKLGLLDAKPLPTFGTWGYKHPLASLGGVCKDISNYLETIQVAFAHPRNKIAPQAVKFVEYERKRQVVRATYSSIPEAIARLKGEIVLVVLKKPGSAKTEEKTCKLEAQHIHGEINMCNRCGILGHTDANCEGRRTDSRNLCRACKPFAKLAHRADEYCALRGSFDHHATQLVEAALAMIEVDGIYAKKNWRWAKAMLADL